MHQKVSLKHVLVEKGLVITICFWKLAYNSDIVVQVQFNIVEIKILLCDSISKIVVLFFFFFFLQLLLDS